MTNCVPKIPSQKILISHHLLCVLYSNGCKRPNHDDAHGKVPPGSYFFLPDFFYAHWLSLEFIKVFLIEMMNKEYYFRIAFNARQQCQEKKQHGFIPIDSKDIINEYQFNKTGAQISLAMLFPI